MSAAAGFVLFRRIQSEVEYLLLRASYGSKHWSPPKGYVDPGEDEYTTALRETKEETGLLDEDLIIYKEHQQELHYPVNGVDKRVVYWLAELKDPEKEVTLSEEHLELSWAKYSDAIKLANYKDFVDMLGRYDDIIRNCLTKK